MYEAENEHHMSPLSTQLGQCWIVLIGQLLWRGNCTNDNISTESYLKCKVALQQKELQLALTVSVALLTPLQPTNTHTNFADQPV